ncbi:MAG: hypothetical protein ABEJ73_12850 [Haloplanus sp.]
MIPQHPETLSVVVGIVLVALVANAALLAYAWLRRSRDTDTVRRVGTRERPADTPAPATIRCPNCGSANDPDYRFCRECVAELPGGAAYAPRGASSFGRLIG